VGGVDAHAWDDRYAAVDRVWSSGPNQLVAETLAGLPPGDALDLACGEGRNALWLAGLGWRVTALDFSRVAVERGRRLATEAGLTVAWEVGDVLTAPLPEVDLVVVAYLQLPAHERRTAVRRAWDRLRPGGTFLLVAHDTTNLTEGTGGPQDATVLMTAGEVLEDLADADAAGVEVVRAERGARRVETEDGHGGTTERVAWDAVVHLRRR
jgi:SAM-dependent methyltransferase